MNLINSRYKILNCLEQENYYSQCVALDLMKKGEKVLLYMINYTHNTKSFIEYCNSNFYEISSYNQASLMNIYSYGIIETIDDKSIEDTIFFYTTEYVDAISFESIDKPLTQNELLDIYKQLSCALDFLYHHGVVYKYISLETVKLTKKDGKFIVKLLDIISIYRMENMRTYLNPSTYSFLAPEIGVGAEIGTFTDIYSLGCLLYYMLTLNILDHRGSDLSGNTYNKDEFSGRLFDIIRRMTSRGIENRYQTLHECNDDIRKLYCISEAIEDLQDIDKINFKIPLIGRDHELRQILSACETIQDRVRKFNRNLILINGDRGIGKTRLLNEVSHLMKWKKIKSFHITINQKSEGFRDILGDILKQFIKISNESQIAKYGRELIKLVPELALNRDIVPSQPLPKEQEELRLYDRIANFIFDISIVHPSVILIDDFQLANKSLIQFLDYLLNLNKSKKSPILLILGYRDNDFYYDQSYDFINKWCLDNALSIKLSHLTVEETARMIKHILGWRKEPLRFASRIMRDTEGNPSYIEEVMKELYSQGVLEFNYSTTHKGFAPIINIEDYNNIIISKNIDESIFKQVKSLNDISREILDIVSLFSTSISKDIICEMLEVKKTDCYDDYFFNLTQLKILNEKFDDWGYTYGFYNKDFKKHIYSNIDENKRSLLHIKASNILEDLYREEGRENKDELIYHLMQSNQKDKSINYCIQSGIGMLKLSVYEQAYTFFKLAHELMENDTDPRKLTVLKNLGEISQKLLKNNDAVYYLNYAQKLANLQNKPKEYINAKIKIGLIHSILNEFDLAQTYLEESINYAKDIEYIDGIMEGAYLLGRLYMQMRELQKMKFVSEEYFEYALKQDNSHYMGMFMGLRGVAEYFEENISTALEFFKESVEYLKNASEIEETARSINNIGVIYHDHYQDAHSARVYFEKALRISEQYRKTDGIIIFSNNIADTYISEHDYYKAIDVLKKNLDLVLEYDEQISTLLVYSNLIISYVSIGEYNQAYMYLLKGNAIYKNKNLSYRGMYLETFLEACAKFYFEIGAYNKAIQIIEEFFEKFSHTKFLIKLRMRKLHYFAKYYSAKFVEDKELIELINDYRETPYIRDRRMLLLDAANYFAEKLEINEVQCILEEDYSLVSIVNNDYFILKREYIESFLLDMEQQTIALENLLLNKKIHKFKELNWKINTKLGNLHLKSLSFFRSINSLINALDIIYILFNTVPSKFKKQYLLKDDKSLVRINLFRIGKLISSDRSKDLTNVTDVNNYNHYLEQFITRNGLEDFFDIIEFQNILHNKKFYQLAVEYYDRVNKTNIITMEQLIASFTDNNIKNLNNLLKLACRATLASRGAIIDIDSHKAIAEVGQSIPQDTINNILDGGSGINKGIFSKSTLNPTRDYNKDYFGNDTRALICMPIYKDGGSTRDEGIVENNRKNHNEHQKKALGYLYLETDKVVNNFSEEALKFCENLLPLASLLLYNHHLTIFSSIDKMTGTYMRKYFEQVFTEEIQHSIEGNKPLSVIMLDIDYFKNVNDIYGHQKGDVVLTDIGKIIKSNIRTTDYVGRYGGEEFVVILPGASKEDAYNIAEKVRKNVENSKLLGDDNKLTISCGIATFPYDAKEQNQLIEKADQALYNAKENGRNKSIIWEKDIVLGSKRVDKLAGIVTGNNIQDQRNVLVITEIIELLNKSNSIQDKIFMALGRLIEILEAEEGIVFTIENTKINKKHYRKRFVEDWVKPFIFNNDLIKNTISSMEGKYLIDWENVNDLDPLTNTPNWKSVIVVPILVNGKVCGVIYLSVPIKEKEFDYAAYNLVEITSNIIGAILKIGE